MKKAIYLLLLLAMCMGLFTACSEKAADSSQDAAATVQNAVENSQEENVTPSVVSYDENQYYNTYISADPTSFDVSLRSDSYSNTVLINIMEGLIRTVEENGDYVTSPGDAQTWECSEDGLVWTFHLGDNKWTDGEPVTASQYVYSLQRSADPATGCPNGWFLSPILNYTAISNGEMKADQLGVKALDDKTLEITLSAVTPTFLKMIDATVYYPQRQDKIEEWGEKYGSEAKYTICNGPFSVETWTHNSSVVLKKNPNYWDNESVKLETVTIAIMSDDTTITSAFESGELDSASTAYQEWVDKFSQRDDSKYVNSVNNTVLYSFYNTKNELFQNTNIRKAFTLALDREDVNTMCFNDLRVPAYGWVAPTVSVGDLNYREQAGELVKEMQDELAANGQTPKDLLLQGMKELGLGDDPASLKITYSLAGTDAWFHTFGEYMQQVYKEDLGMNVEVTFNDWSIFYDNVQKGNYQIGYMSWGAYYNDPYDVLSAFDSQYDQTSTGWKNDTYDKLVKTSASEMDEAKRLQEYIDAENILIKQDCVVSPLAVATSNTFYKNYVYGYSTLGFSNAGFKTMYTSGRK